MTTSGSLAGLEYDLSLPDGDGRDGTVAVLLHGRGSHKGDLQALRPVLPDGWTLVTPQAPYPGPPWGYGPGWAWYRYLEEDRVERDTLDRSLETLDGFLDRLPEILDPAPGRIVLGGFSQGGTTSLAYALTRSRPLAAAWNFSGFLEASVDADGTGRGAPPLFWGHGLRDANIPIALAERGRARLEAADVPLVWRSYDIGHWMVPDEVHEAVALVDAGA